MAQTARIGGCRTSTRKGLTRAAPVKENQVQLDFWDLLDMKDVSACGTMEISSLSLPKLLLQMMKCTKQQNGKKHEEEKWKPEERNAKEDDDCRNMEHHHSLPFFSHLSTTIRATHIFSLLPSIIFAKDRNHQAKML